MFAYGDSTGIGDGITVSFSLFLFDENKKTPTMIIIKAPTAQARFFTRFNLIYREKFPECQVKLITIIFKKETL